MREKLEKEMREMTEMRNEKITKRQKIKNLTNN